MSENELTLDDLIAFAKSRGGECLSDAYHDTGHKYAWRCARGHEFQASARLLIEGGYWCPTCFPRVEDTGGWDWDVQAAVDPLLRQFHRS